MSFLKRRFIEVEGVVVGGLENSCFAKMLNWTRKASWHRYKLAEDVDYEEDTIIATARTIVTEACLRGKVFYEGITKHLKECDKTYGLGLEVYQSFESVFASTIFDAIDGKTTIGSPVLEAKSDTEFPTRFSTCISILKNYTPIF